MRRVAGVALFAWMMSGGMFPRLGYGQPVVTGAGYATPRATDAAPGQVLTIFVRVPGKTPSDPVTAKAPLPVTLAGFSVVLRQTYPADPQAVPILAEADAQSCSTVTPMTCVTTSMVTVQVPFELTPNPPPNTVPKPTAPQNFARLEISYNGSVADTLALNPVVDRIHVLNTCDPAAGPGPAAACVPEVAHADGSLVSAGHPAQPGEVLTVSVVGLGAVSGGAGTVVTGSAAPQPPPAVSGVLVDFNNRANVPPSMPIAATAAAANSAQMQAGSVGIYQIMFTVPALPPGTPGCGGTVASNLTIDIGRTASYDGAGICVDPPAGGAAGARGRER